MGMSISSLHITYAHVYTYTVCNIDQSNKMPGDGSGRVDLILFPMYHEAGVKHFQTPPTG